MSVNTLLSIITVTYNPGKQINQTFDSILPHLSNEVEYIIIDGGSTDGTVAEISKIEDKLYYWVSEIDNGIYNAMNKGISRARGKYLYFINAGDLLTTLPNEILSSHKADLLCFPVKLSNNDIFYPSIGNKIKLTNTLPHQGCFYRNSPAIRYDERFKIFADFSLNQELYKTRSQISIFNLPIVAYHSLDGISHNKSALSEIFEVVESNFGYTYRALSVVFFKFYGLRNRVSKIFNIHSKKN